MVAVIGRSAAPSASTFQASGLFVRIHKLPMFGSFGCGKEFVLTDIIPFGFDMSTGVNFFLSWLAGGMVIAPSSTTTTPPAGTSSSKGRDAPAGCPRVVPGGCGTLESCVVVLHLVKKLKID